MVNVKTNISIREPKNRGNVLTYSRYYRKKETNKNLIMIVHIMYIECKTFLKLKRLED